MAPNDDSESGFLTSRGGVSLFYAYSSSASQVSDEEAPIVVVLHGYGEHCGRYDHVVERLNAAGMSALRIDFRGHGQSGGQRGHVVRFDDYLADVDTAIESARAHCPNRPVYLLGHSQGGLIALVFLSERAVDVAGAVVTSPFLGFSMKVPLWKALLGKVLSRWVPGFGLPSDVDAGHLSHDTDVVRAYQTDTLVHGRASARWFTEILAAQERLEVNARGIREPVLVLQAGDDRLVDPAATARVFRQLGSEDKSLETYDTLFHEILNEPEAPEILDQIVTWIQERTVSEAS